MFGLYWLASFLTLCLCCLAWLFSRLACSSDAAFVVPPSEKYICKLHICWTDALAFSQLRIDCGTLAVIQEASWFSLGNKNACRGAWHAYLIVPPVLWTNTSCHKMLWNRWPALPALKLRCHGLLDWELTLAYDAGPFLLFGVCPTEQTFCLAVFKFDCLSFPWVNPSSWWTLPLLCSMTWTVWLRLPKAITISQTL